jgi:DNA-binding beta-propeller fold protein YncE
VRRAVLLAVLLVAGACGAIALAQGSKENGRIGPTNQVQPNGRKVKPAGKLTTVGNHPGGGALTTNGRFMWTLSAGRGKNDIRIVQVASSRRCKRPRRPKRVRKSASKRAKARYRKRVRRYRKRRRRYKRCLKLRARDVGRVVQSIRMPGLSGGIAMAPDGRTAYVSGLKDSPHEDQKTPADVPGKQGDVIHVLTYNGGDGTATRAGLISVPPPSDAPAPQDFPPTSMTKKSWPRDLAISPDGKTLLAALNLADNAAVIDTRTKAVRYVPTAHYPYGAGITKDGKFGLVSNETPGTVSVINLASASKVKDIQVGPRLSHPEGIAVDPRTKRAYVALANQDVIAVIDTGGMKVERTLSVARPQGTGSSPVALSVTPGGCYLLSSDAGEDAIALFALPSAAGKTCSNSAKAKKRKKAKKHKKARKHTKGRAAKKKRKHKKRRKRRTAEVFARPFELVGRIPTAAYPVAAESSRTRTLAWVAAKGVGVGPNINGPNPRSTKDSDDEINSFQYLPAIVSGTTGVLKFPTYAQLGKMTPVADRELVPTDAERPPPGTPIRGPGGPIKHVFYIVKENRTYDQVIGDDPRGDGDPNLTLFGQKFTPNLHALAQRFPLLDHVFANSEASIDGHYWTAAGAVSDYVVKGWHQNYSGRGRPYDFGSYVVSQPPKGYIFQRAENEGVSYFNYGEALAGLSPLPDKDRDATNEETNLAAKILTHSDIGTPQPGCYDSDISNSSVLGQNQIEVYDSSLPPGAPPGSHSRFDCFMARFSGQVATGGVPAFNYMVLPQNHTEGTTPGRRTPDAQIASNDWGLGQIVDLISHSSIWNESLILVIEDDSQDGADHVDAHRIPALAISPWTQRGAVIHTRYDQLSFLRTAEIITGLKSLHLAEALATPLYDAFGTSPANAEPYNAVTPSVDMTARNTAATAGARESSRLPLNQLDRIPQRTLDKLLWKYRHGPHAEAPPAGPNAVGEEKGH